MKGGFSVAYSDFTLETVIERFQIILARQPLFSNLAAVPVPVSLSERLAEGQPYAPRSEKARSEFIVVPILLAIVHLSQNRVSIYSGQRFDVDPASGLAGECDFILSATEPVPIVRAPIVSVIEAKKADLDLGYGQCAAQMLGSLRFNQRQPDSKSFVYGCVTTGEEWLFLRLDNNTLTFDSHTVYLSDVGQILAIFLRIIDEMV